MRPRNFFNEDTTYYYKGEQQPSLFEVRVEKDLYEHLLHDDLDETSKQEVAYRIMKE